MYPFASDLEFARSRMQERLRRSELARLARRPRIEEPGRSSIHELAPLRAEPHAFDAAEACCESQAS